MKFYQSHTSCFKRSSAIFFSKLEDESSFAYSISSSGLRFLKSFLSVLLTVESCLFNLVNTKPISLLWGKNNRLKDSGDWACAL